jgi:hypothetical protein
MDALDARLRSQGGGLNPAVNFQLTNWFSRNFTRTFETAKDLAGYLGFMSRVSRDSLTTRFSHHRNDWFLLVHPGVLPMHIDDFLPAWNRRVDLPGLTLTDLGDVLTESLFRRDAMDRASASHVVTEQLRRLDDEIPSLVIHGGNDYALRFASHVVDAPIEGDRQYIINYEVPFFPMVLHGYLEFAGRPANIRESFHANQVLLTSMATGASPRYTLSAQPTRMTQFSPHERLYSTHYINWMATAIEHYRIFNEVYAPLRDVPIADFEVLNRHFGNQVSVTIFENGTRIYVNQTNQPFDNGAAVVPAMWFVVEGGACCD